ncbi:hypothetical protein Cflav_PD1792 [Pedosphaera parvula Ellin514]|uniref:Uncharacterized protein n=1 Tax=Pedosphaera parvula (strain Ellin514) TaxID=320771 RepID=B9XN34_PEDPL|nr:hypothetical protein Cflav_PD1792 [Pedosphaera parvula Ellin514]
MRTDNPFLSCAMSATKENACRLNAMAYDLAPAMIAERGQSMYRTFKTIKIMGNAIHHYLEVFVIFISTSFTLGHKVPLVECWYRIHGQIFPPVGFQKTAMPNFNSCCQIN